MFYPRTDCQIIVHELQCKTSDPPYNLEIMDRELDYLKC